jgi:hypothetical protein
MEKYSNAFFSETTNIIKAKLYMTFMYSLALIIFVVSEKKAFEHFSIGSNANLCIAVIGRSSTRCVFFMPIGYPRWPPPQDIY